MANNGRQVDLTVKAKDEFGSTLSRLEKAQKRIIDQNKEIAARPPGELRKFYQDTKQSIDAAQTSVERLAREFRDLSQAEGDNRVALGALLIEKQKVQTKAAQLKASLQGVREESQRLKSTQQGGFQAFNATATAMEREARAARNLAAARTAANDRLRGMIDARAAAPVRSGFNSFSSGAEARVAADQDGRIRDHGCQVFVCYTKAEAVEVLLRHMPGALIT